MMTMYIILLTVAFLSRETSAWIDCVTCKHRKCDDNNNCLEGCVRGYAGPKCKIGCPSHCIDSLCEFDKYIGNYPCSVGCKPGYHGIQCNARCHSLDIKGTCDRFSGTAPACGGTRYGKKCEMTCKNKCGGFVCDNKGKCFDEVCIPGWHGATCSKSCKDNCKICHRETGRCVQHYADEDLPFKDKSIVDIGSAMVVIVYLLSGILVTFILFGICHFISIFYLNTRKGPIRTKVEGNNTSRSNHNGEEYQPPRYRQIVSSQTNDSELWLTRDNEDEKRGIMRTSEENTKFKQQKLFTEENEPLRYRHVVSSLKNDYE